MGEGTDVKAERLPKREEVAIADTWDLTYLYESDAAWSEALEAIKPLVEKLAKFRGRLGESSDVLRECLELDSQIDRLGDRLGNYAYLKTAEDQTNSHYQSLVGRYRFESTRAAEAASFIRPELLRLPIETLQAYLKDPKLALFRLQLERLVRFKPHTLGEKEEQLLAMQGEMAQAASNAFRQLLDADLKFGLIDDETGIQRELSNATFVQLLHSPSREVRRQTFHQYYAQYDAHKHTLTATLSGSIQRDAYYARARGYSSSLESALFPDNVPREVYENLVATVRAGLPAVHRFYEVRRRKMGLEKIHHYDTYVPILSELKVQHSWDEAVEKVLDSLRPLGSQYVNTLAEGLRGRWCDRYPNVGKQSGAFSYGTYDGLPYIMMNYKPNVLHDVFTLTHEAGHSMHSWFSSKHQPYQYHNYTIFVAEVASTFNEQLLARYLMEHSTAPQMKAYLINQQIDDIRSTIVRQTMFAEFEQRTHAACEAGDALTVDSFREIYGELLDAYFGPQFVIDPELRLECFRIPHFYNAFYVYKYATGLSAAIALSDRVTNGGAAELDDYLGFLKSGCSQDPLDLLKAAGVDMWTPAPIESALQRLDTLVTELDDLLPDA
ncbi:MAG: oligoendopeptidase F [Planctomycetaceae bacterium]|nr:oligoendopeptidase F [Planctomycetaceae bacterium]